MRFRLVYDGPLSTGNADSHGKNKWVIRQQLAPQLEELWRLKPALQGHADAEFHFSYGPGGAIRMELDKDMTPNERRLSNLRKPIVRAGYGYLPIVRKELFLRCTLDILFLRKDDPGGAVSNQGDLDNRLKNLFDALRPPMDNEARPVDIVDDPLHVLAEDDQLITSFAVSTDRLLTRFNSAPNAVMLIMDVTVKPYRIQAALNSAFAWD